MNTEVIASNHRSAYNRTDLPQLHWGWFLALGIILVGLGVAAVAAPLVATLTAELLFGWLLVVSGIAHGIHAFRGRNWKGSMFQILLGVFSLAVGIMLLLYPLRGVLTLTLVLAAFFVAEGIAKIMMAVQLRSTPKWGWLLVSGLLALLLGILIWIEFPGTAAWVIGVLLGIDLVFSGVALIMLALAYRSQVTNTVATT
jgi:uncharacterized membrane protein HdeD (DUF308 family)